MADPNHFLQCMYSFITTRECGISRIHPCVSL